MTPRRIQRRRTAGWRMPEGAVYVGRGTMWGNPFVAGKPSGVFPEGMGFRGQAETLIPSLSLAQSLAMYAELLDGFIGPEMYPLGHDWMAVFKCRTNNWHPSEAARSQLRGHDLACWCRLCPEHANGLPLGVTCAACEPCHADVLLEIANPDLALAPPTATCERCQGTGEIITDWDRYMEPRRGDGGDEAVAECPECNGTGVAPPTDRRAG